MFEDILVFKPGASITITAIGNAYMYRVDNGAPFPRWSSTISARWRVHLSGLPGVAFIENVYSKQREMFQGLTLRSKTDLAFTRLKPKTKAPPKLRTKQPTSPIERKVLSSGFGSGAFFGL